MGLDLIRSDAKYKMGTFFIKESFEEDKIIFHTKKRMKPILRSSLLYLESRFFSQTKSSSCKTV